MFRKLPRKIYSLTKEYYTTQSRLVSYDILEVSSNKNKLYTDAKNFQHDCFEFGDRYFDNVEESSKEHTKDTLTCWQAGNGFYCGYMRDPSTNICYRVSENSIIVV